MRGTFRSTSLGLASSAALLLAACLPAQAKRGPEPDPTALIQEAAWQEDEVGVGVVLRRSWFPELFSGPQSIAVLTLEAGVRLDVVQAAPLDRTSSIAASFGGLVAVNGGFFNTKTGAPLGLIQVDGESVVPATEVQRTGQSAFGVDARNRVTVREVPPGRWAGVEDALGGSALLVENGRAVSWANAARHPRTVLGVRKDGAVLLACVDGRSDKAAGMSYAELSTLMIALGCEAAVNLDGGGSSTMWTLGLGIVNHPSDNGKFDAGGERAVANAVVVSAPAVRVFDEDALGLPDGAAHVEAADDGYRGDAAVLAGDAALRFTFSLEALRPGTYALEARWPRVRDAKPGRVTVELGGADTKRLDQRSKVGRWQRFATVAVGADPVEVVWRGEEGKDVIVDAIRLVEVAGAPR